jgi:hypothetical protein
MKAGKPIIAEIMEALKKGDALALRKYSLRYPQDGQLRRLCEKHEQNASIAELMLGLKKIMESRMYDGKATQLPLKDRRKLKTFDKKTQDL